MNSPVEIYRRHCVDSAVASVMERCKDRTEISRQELSEMLTTAAHLAVESFQSALKRETMLIDLALEHRLRALRYTTPAHILKIVE